LGRRVVVIGGGNVAYDVGRTVLRQISLDTARAAMRESTVGEVVLCSLESLDEMPADDLEIIEGDEEGVVRRNSLGPVEILTNGDGHVRGVLFRKCTRVFDEQRRFAPQFDDSVRETIECDNVLIAVGQGVDLRFVDAGRDGIEVSERGFIVCDAETGRTTAPDVFVVGDLAYGPKLLIHAVASGKQIARSIYQSVTGRAIDFRDVQLHLAIPDYAREQGYEHRARVGMRTTSPEERLRGQNVPVELGYTEEEARLEAQRCLDCGVNTIFDGEKCILCGGCVDVCPSLCLRIVSADRLPDQPELRDLVERHLDGMPAEQASAILKDETICIRCALCAERCPTGAITMERFLFKEVPACQAA
jgi:ferredoxin